MLPAHSLVINVFNFVKMLSCLHTTLFSIFLNFVKMLSCLHAALFSIFLNSVLTLSCLHIALFSIFLNFVLTLSCLHIALFSIFLNTVIILFQFTVCCYSATQLLNPTLGLARYADIFIYKQHTMRVDVFMLTNF